MEQKRERYDCIVVGCTDVDNDFDVEVDHSHSCRKGDKGECGCFGVHHLKLIRANQSSCVRC